MRRFRKSRSQTRQTINKAADKIWIEETAEAAIHWARIEQAFHRANSHLRKKLREIRLRAGREPSFDYISAIAGLDWTAEYGSILTASWVPAVQRAAMASALDQLRKSSDGTVSIVERLVKTQGRSKMAERVVQVTNGTRDGIRSRIINGLDQGHSIDKIAKSLEEKVGLTKAQQDAQDRFEARLRERGIKGQKFERMAEQGYRKRIQYRTRNIARTEINTAIGDGKMAAWRAQKMAGEIPQNAAKQWLTRRPGIRGSPCKICEPLDRMIVPLDQPFVTDKFVGMNKPSHPQCVCVVQLVPFPDEL